MDTHLQTAPSIISRHHSTSTVPLQSRRNRTKNTSTKSINLWPSFPVWTSLPHIPRARGSQSYHLPSQSLHLKHIRDRLPQQQHIATETRPLTFTHNIVMTEHKILHCIGSTMGEQKGFRGTTSRLWKKPPYILTTTGASKQDSPRLCLNRLQPPTIKGSYLREDGQ